MAVVTVAFDGTRLSAAESESDGGTWDDWGKSTSPTQETDFVYQGTFSISNKISSGQGGVDFDSTSTTDLETIPRVILAKINITTYGIINTSSLEGVSYQIGSGGSAYYNYFLFGSGLDYPFTGGWQLLAIDPNEVQYRNATVGSPDLSLANYYGLFADIISSAKSDNVVHDALDFFDSGKGLTLSGGDGADTDGRFQDFIDFDEGDALNRFGVSTTKDGIIYVLGTLSVGSGTVDTVFTDSNQVLVFPDARVGTGFFGLRFRNFTSSNVYNVENCSFIGKGNITASVDTRPDYTVVGSSGAVNFTGSTFNVFRNVEATSSVTLRDCIFLSGNEIVQSGATFDGCTYSEATTRDGTASLKMDNPDLVLNSVFNFSDGHAVELLTSGTFTFDANFFNGFTGDDTSGSAIFNSTGEHITLNIVNLGDSPSVRNSNGSVTNIINAVNLTITCVDTNQNPLENVACWILSGSTVVMNEFTNASGVATESVNFSGEVPITVRVRKSSKDGDPRFVPVTTAGNITANGFSLTQVLIEDSIADC